MGIISNIIDLVKDAKEGLDEFTSGNFVFRTTRNSISRKSSDSIMQFPVICSGGLSPDDLMMITKALEREYAQFIRIAASLDDVIDANTPEAKLNKVRSLHQNIGFHGQGGVSFKNNMPRFPFFNEGADLKYTTLCEDFRRKNIELLKIANEDLNMTILNDMSTKNIDNYYKLGEAKPVDQMSDDELARGIRELQYKNALSKHGMDKDEKVRNAEKYKWASAAERRNAEKHEYEMNMKKIQDQRAQNEYEFNRERLVQKPVIDFGKQLLSTDVKKANELVPTMMELQFIYRTKGGQMMNTNIIVGVKAVAHIVSSEEMVTNVASAVKEKRHFFKFLQWTTGEIEMVKDWILAKDKIRDEVRRQRAGKESDWWRRLKGRSAEDKLRRFTFNKKDILPNSTLVITMDEVEMIQNTYNINILKDSRARRALFSTFFLLGLVIVDPAAELAYFAFDGQEDYQVQSYRSLEKESSSSADMKSLISLVDKNGR